MTTRDGALSTATLIASIVVGAAAMASAVVLLMLQPHFRYPDCDPVAETKDGHGS